MMICLIRISSNRIIICTILGFTFFGILIGLPENVPAQVPAEEDLVEYLEEAPVEEESDSDEWNRVFLRASYRHYYRLKANFTNDVSGIPYNAEQEDETMETKIFNSYGSESIIHLTNNVHSYIRFDYSFIETVDHYQEEYQNNPKVDLYEAYLNYQRNSHRIQVGGLIFKLGSVDIDSPIDILSLKDRDKVNHLDETNVKYIMPALHYWYRNPDSTWEIFWGPFQRASDEKQSVRANVGVQYKLKSEAMEMGVSFFNWFDPDNEITLEVERDADSSNDTLEPVFEDTPIRFITFDFDITTGDYVFKGDFGYFFQKNFYHISRMTAADSTTDIVEFETLQLKHIAFSLSAERKFDRLFFLSSYSYRLVLDVPADAHIYQYENEEEPVGFTRDLHRHQLAVYALWEGGDDWEISLLVFGSFPYRRSGFSFRMDWKSDDSKWDLMVSHVETDRNKMSDRITDLNRLQLEYALRF